MSSCCHQTSCNIPTCKFYPEFKKSLEGLTWYRIIQSLIKLKLQSSKEYAKTLRISNILKDKNNLTFYVTLLGFYKRRFCLREGITSSWSSCHNSQCSKAHKEVFDRYDERVFSAINVSELLKIIDENHIHSIRFGISNIFKRNSKYSLHDTRCPNTLDCKY